MEHTCILVKQIGNLLLNDQLSDVALIVEGHVLPAHRIILASSGEYFRYLASICVISCAESSETLSRVYSMHVMRWQ